MTPPTQLEFCDVRQVVGPLVVLKRVEGVGWDEFAQVRLPSGETRQGLVLEVDEDTAVVQILQGTQGIGLSGVRLAFEGRPLHIPVGEGWLGRVCDGLGQPRDGGPPVFGETLRPVAGAPMNPVARATPSEPVLTGVSAIDALTTLVRGQKLPIFSVAGLPHLELATQIAAQAHAGDEPFKVVFAGMGLSHPDAAAVRDVLEERAAAGELTLFLNTADDPVIERVLTPRLALTVAEYLAFVRGQHVLVVVADMTSYAEAVREVSAARGEVPGRRAYPGYLYSDLASLYERCGRIAGRPGSVTLVPVLTMPGGDITHPIPDLTGYITEGQIVLSRTLHGQGVFPPIDVLPSLSRLMNAGIGTGKTVREHRRWADQLYAIYARGRDARMMASIVGEAGLGDADRRARDFANRFERELIAQGRTRRGVQETIAIGWRLLESLPRDDLERIDDETWARRPGASV